MAPTASTSAAPHAAQAPKTIRPQAGYQEAILSSSADIAIGGGQAGAGKTFALLLEPLRHVGNADFGAVVFRRETPQITNEGGLWDESERLYGGLKAKPNRNELSWTFRDGAKVRFAHMQHATDRFSWDGSQIPLIGFDQLEHFEEVQFWYMLSRNRSACGVRPYLRATCNPVPDDDPTGAWLHKLISWWIDQETGYPLLERSGVLRWFVRLNDELYWADSREALLAQFPDADPDELQPKSLTFIPGSLDDNQILLAIDPGYRANLLALPTVERERLLRGNWKVKPAVGKVFNRAWFKTFLPVAPADVVAWVRYWDKAGTEDGGKRTAGVLIGKRKSGRYVVADVVKGQWGAHNREVTIKQVAEADRFRCGDAPHETWLEQEPGSGGKESAENTVMNLAGHVVRAERVTGDKVTRSGPFAAQCEAGNVDVVQATWTEEYIAELHNFDGKAGFMDQVDASSGAFNKVAKVKPRRLTW